MELRFCCLGQDSIVKEILNLSGIVPDKIKVKKKSMVLIGILLKVL